MDSNYPQELRDDATAALTLSFLKHTKFDTKTINDLNNMKKCFLIRQGQTKFIYGLPEISPNPQLDGIIGTRSEAYEKLLRNTDTNPSQGRLINIPKEYVESYILPLLNKEKEVNKLSKEGIKVTVYVPQGKSFNMVFKLWSSKSYVLTSGWNEFHKHYQLIAEKHIVKLRMFRHAKDNNKIGFLISCRRTENSDPTVKKGYAKFPPRVEYSKKKLE